MQKIKRTGKKEELLGLLITHVLIVIVEEYLEKLISKLGHELGTSVIVRACY